MSFKDVHDLSEHLKLLGFPRLFPLQALATQHGSLANFHIVAELLQWLARLLEPGALLAGSVQTEEQRVLLIRAASEFFLTKSGIRLNPRKLYAAAAVSATELQKITRLLITPAQTEEESEDQDEDRQQYYSLNQVDIGDKMDELRRARELSSNLTQGGAGLYDLLSKELGNKKVHIAQTPQPMELISVERTMKNAIQVSQLKLQSSRAHLENARIELNAFTSKLLRKRAELDRTKQRLEALQKIRPAHMAEFEECEKELQQLFQRYFLRFHIREALRNQLEARTKRRVTPIYLLPLLQKPAENSMPFIPEGLIEDEDDDDDGDDGDGDGQMCNELPRERSFGLDSEIPDIRDEDLLVQRSRAAKGGLTAAALSQRPCTTTTRTRPTTGRSRRTIATASASSSSGARTTHIERNAPSSSMLNRRTDNDSSFGSSDSELDMGDIIGRFAGTGDDDFDLNSIDDISISKLTGEMPLRPKTSSKTEHHSDEDF
ncbi:clusterin-associated protein 1-like [Drosophila hydei]|uniref:Clusterin-associated protein 1-like n=1 Tax=Drosophila hydei TaxID=7224 RepID=A0A6J2SSE5_DROHY|nr:clusterin-associated protein 1-like [Drosophila hydei]